MTRGSGRHTISFKLTGEETPYAYVGAIVDGDYSCEIGAFENVVPSNIWMIGTFDGFLYGRGEGDGGSVNAFDYRMQADCEEGDTLSAGCVVTVGVDMDKRIEATVLFWVDGQPYNSSMNGSWETEKRMRFAVSIGTHGDTLQIVPDPVLCEPSDWRKYAQYNRNNPDFGNDSNWMGS